jgi:predicted alpha/beta-hydrolase family hydrolase
MRPHVDGLVGRGVEARAIDLPTRRAEAAVPNFEAAIADERHVVIGGHSYGGRVASLLAATRTVAGLVLLSYPLHAPGRSDWERRIEHWDAIACPVLLLSGEADPFARIELLRAAAPRLRQAELVTYPSVGHGLAPVLDAALDRVARFIDSLPPAER